MKAHSRKATLLATILSAGAFAGTLMWAVSRSAADTQQDARLQIRGNAGRELLDDAAKADTESALSMSGGDERGEVETVRWPANPPFAQKVAGTWLEWFGGGQTMFNIRADGTFDWFGSWFMGDGSEAYSDGPAYGSWKRTGLCEITTIEIGFLFNGDGSFYGTGRVREIFTFDDDFQSFSYVGTEDVFPADQDPADPNAVPSATFHWGPFGPVNRMNFMD